MAKRTPNRRESPPQVALIVETSLAYGRGLLRGIGRYIRENGPWYVYLEQRSLYDPLPPWLESWKGDGIISRASDPEMAARVAQTGLPVIDLNEEVQGIGQAMIYNDHLQIGQVAAEHFLERGFTQFAYLGYPGLSWSNRRLEGFAQTVQDLGHSLSVYSRKDSKNTTTPLSWEEEFDDVTTWIKMLPKPVGVMACNDFRAIQLIDACHSAEVAIPDQVAVIGVDNEDVASELCVPPLTSIIPDSEKIGYRAAEILDSLMQEIDFPKVEEFIPARGIVTRQSTEVTAIADPDVRRAMHLIRQHASDGITVNEILEKVPVSRSVLQRRFRSILGNSIHEIITKVKLDRVQELLRETELSLPEIAERSGFTHSEYLSAIFKKKMNMTVTEYRNRFI